MEKICNLCNKPYSFATRTAYDAKAGKITCVHDKPQNLSYWSTSDGKAIAANYEKMLQAEKALNS